MAFIPVYSDFSAANWLLRFCKYSLPTLGGKTFSFSYCMRLKIDPLVFGLQNRFAGLFKGVEHLISASIQEKYPVLLSKFQEISLGLFQLFFGFGKLAYSTRP